MENIIDLNRRLGVRSDLLNLANETVRKAEYSDARPVKIPDYIKKLAKAPYDDPRMGIKTTSKLGTHDANGNYSEDIPIACLIETNVGQHINDYHILLKDKIEKLQSVLNNNYDRFILMLLKASDKELAKRQILVGSPTFHHGCSDGDHFNHPSADDQNKVLISHGIVLARLLKDKFNSGQRFNPESKFTVPLMTSQGVLLKSKRDSDKFRQISKLIQARLAMLARNVDDLNMITDAFDDAFERAGYDRVAKSFFLGKRKQHAAKPELLDDGSDILETTLHYQGRTRGIFPPSELHKVYYKPYADAIKKVLFTKTELCNVDPEKITRAVNRATQHYLMSDDYATHGFYDLSAYDRNTGVIFFKAYDAFLDEFFLDKANRLGDHFGSFSLLFPASCAYDSDILLQPVKGRSTLSGQPDVTVKNNICHIIVLIEAFIRLCKKKHLDCDSYEVCEFLVCNEGNLMKEFPEFTAKIHGDDAFVSWVGMTSDDMAVIYETFSDYGIPCAAEEALVYLKKTSDPGKIKDHRIDIDSSLVNIAGSLVRNRFGEYETNDYFIHLLSLIDTWSKLSEPDKLDVNIIWNTFYLYCKSKMLELHDLGLYSNDIELEALSLIRACDDISDFTIDHFKKLASVVNLRMQSKSTKAVKARQFLSRLYYSNQELIDSEDLMDAYGNLHYDPSLSDYGSLQSLDLKHLLDIAITLQEYLLDTEGEVPSDVVLAQMGINGLAISK